MEGNIGGNLEGGVQAFIMALYSVTVIFLGVGIAFSVYMDILELLPLLTGYLPYAIWIAYGLLIAGFFSLVLMGLSLGFGRYDYTLGFLGLSLILTGIYEVSFIGIYYILGNDPIQLAAPGVAGGIKILAGVLGIKFAREITEERILRFILLTAAILVIIIIKGLAPVISQIYAGGQLDYSLIGYMFIYNLFMQCAQDIVLISLGGFLAPLAVISTIIGLLIAKKKGGLRASYGAKLSLGFAALAGILGVFLTSISNISAVTIAFIATLINIRADALNSFIVSLDAITFFGLTALVFYVFSNYYIVISVPTEVRREVPIEETIERATVTERPPEERRERAEELIEELEELEFEELEDFEL